MLLSALRFLSGLKFKIARKGNSSLFTGSSDHIGPDPVLDAFCEFAALVDEIASKEFNGFCDLRFCHGIRHDSVFNKVATAKVIHLN